MIPPSLAAARGPTPAPARRLTGEAGSVFAEFALVAPLLVFLVLGIFEFGMAWREKSNITSALRAGARAAASIGADRQGDYLALQSFNSVMADKKGITVNRVVIYRANTATDGGPEAATCFTQLTSPSGGACNVYLPAQFNNLPANSLTNFGLTTATCSAGAWDSNWCPLDRYDRQANGPTGAPPDYLGMWATVTYKSYTKLIPTTITLTDRVVMRIEPRVS